MVNCNAETQFNLSQKSCRKWIHKSGLGFYKVRKSSSWFNVFNLRIKTFTNGGAKEN